MQDKIGQEIEVGQYAMILVNSGSGWDKSTSFHLDVVTRLTEKSVFYGHPKHKKRTKPEKVIILTEEQAEGWIRKENEPERAEAKIEQLFEIQQGCLPIN